MFLTSSIESYLLCVVYNNKTNFARSTMTVPSPYCHMYNNIHFHKKPSVLPCALGFYIASISVTLKYLNIFISIIKSPSISPISIDDMPGHLFS